MMFQTIKLLEHSKVLLLTYVLHESLRVFFYLMYIVSRK